MATRAIQTETTINPEIGDVGNIAEPNAPTLIDSGVIHVPTSARKPRPGDPLLYDNTENAWKIPTSDAEFRAVTAILTYRQDRVATERMVEFADGAEIEFCLVGSIWLLAGEAIERSSLITWDRATFRWDALARPTAVNQMLSSPIYNGNRGTASNGSIIKGRIGLGRVL